MPSRTFAPVLEVEQIGGVTLVRFGPEDFLDEALICAAGDQLLDLVFQGDRLLILDFGNVRRMGSYLVGQLLKVRKELLAAGGRLVMCQVSPVLREIFQLLRLDRLFGIYPKAQEALQSLN